MDISNWFLLVLTVLLILLIRTWMKNRGLPPGPWGLPLVGYYPFLRGDNHIKLAELAGRYGEIYSFRSLGGRLYVVLHGMPILKEVFVNRGDEFSFRPLDTNFLNWADNMQSMTNMEGDVWKEQRRFFLSNIKNYGFGKLEHERLMHEIIENDLIKEIESHNGEPFDLHSTISFATCNMFSELLCSKRFPRDDPKYLGFRKNANKMLSQFHPLLFFVGGFVYDLFLNLTPIGRKLRKAAKGMQAFADEIIEEHIETFDPNNLRDFIDSYLMQLKTLESEGKHQGSSFTRERLTMQFFAMFIEGMETIGVSLYLILLKLAKHEDVQQKLQKEADEVIGPERLPSWTDKPKMPYTDAVLLELYRCTWPFTISTYYNNHSETTLRGYRIPERTDIIFNMWEISNNPKTFPEPSKFDPNRFLGPEAINWKEKGPIPFGIGKRSCPGEAMAQVEVFIILVALMQNFTLYPAENGQVKAKLREKSSG